MREHLASCEECGRALEELRGVLTVLHGMPELEPPFELRDRLRKITAQRAEAPRRRTAYVAAGTAAAAALLVVWLGFGHHLGRSGDQISDAAVRPGAVVERPAADALAPSELPAEATADALAEEAAIAEVAAEASVEAPVEAVGREPTVEPEAPSRIALAPSPEPPASRRPPEPRNRRAPLAPDSVPAAVGDSDPAESAVTEAPDAVEAERSAASLPMPRAAFLDAADGVAQRVGEGSPFTVAVRPPLERYAGMMVPTTIVVETEEDVARATVAVRSEGLELVGIAEDGVIFDGPLRAGQETVLSVRMLARTVGAKSLTLRVRSTDPVVDTELAVAVGYFAESVPPAERPVRFVFEGTPIRSAIASIVRESGLEVAVDESVGEATVTLRMEDAIPARAALQMVVEAAGCRVIETDGLLRVERDGEGI